MRIAHVTDFYLPRLGGIEMHVHDLAVRQLAAGHQVEVVTTSPGSSDGPDVLVHRLAGRVRPGALRAGRALLRSGGYDVVHVHAGPVSPLAFAAVPLATEVPMVVTAHSLLWRLEPLFRVLDDGTDWTRLPAVWTAVSQVAAAPLRRLVAPAPVHVLPNGVDAAPWRTVPVPGSAGDFVIVAVMRLASRKRPLHLLRILRHVRRALPAAVRVRAVIVGDGPLRGSMRRYLRLHGMSGWVDLPGRLTRPAIRDLFAGGDVFVAPATLESFGIAALEARCAGLPVVARAEGGIGELIVDGTEGVLVDSDTAMADALVGLALDAARRARMAAHNRLTVPPVGWAEVLDRTAALYELAIAGSPGQMMRLRSSTARASAPGSNGSHTVIRR